MLLTGIQAAFFYLFAAIAIGSAFMVIAGRNPVHSVLFLILAFVNAAALFLLTGAEFLALILIVVYVGAVAVLFLFVVMLLDVDFAELRAGVATYAPIGTLVGLVFAGELIIVLAGYSFAPELAGTTTLPIPALADRSNTQALGDVLYTTYVFFFQIAGMILLVAMVGAIVLTLRRRDGIQRQNVAQQVARTPETAIELVKVDSGKGI
jgi:NADH-quinone oxidoreductase subunit J